MVSNGAGRVGGFDETMAADGLGAVRPRHGHVCCSLAVHSRYDPGRAEDASYLILVNDAELVESVGEGRARLVDRVQEPEQVLAERPLLSEHSSA